MNQKTQHAPLILASSSPRRLELLKTINIIPSKIISPNLDETALDKENPRLYALRMATQKCLNVPYEEGFFTLSADTVVACGHRILPKAETIEDARYCLELLSGRRHRVWGGVCIRNSENKISSRVICSVVKFKPLSKPEIEEYLKSMEWEGKAGGYAIQGLAASFISFISGSYSNIVGLSLFDVSQILKGQSFFKREV